MSGSIVVSVGYVIEWGVGRRHRSPWALIPLLGVLQKNAFGFPGGGEFLWVSVYNMERYKHARDRCYSTWTNSNVAIVFFLLCANSIFICTLTAMLLVPYGEKNFLGKFFLWVKFLLRLIFVGQATWLLFVPLNARCRQVFVCLIFMDQATHKNVSHKNFYQKFLKNLSAETFFCSRSFFYCLRLIKIFMFVVDRVLN